MAFRFKKASCVVIGTLNMYILQPQWLAKHGIIERGMDVAIETNLARPGVRFHLQKYDAIWGVSPERILIESTSPKTDCGEIIARVLEALPETPLFAIGNNVTFEADLAEMEQLPSAIRGFPMPECPAEAGRIEQRTFHIGVRKNDHDSMNLQLAVLQEKIELACNAHRKLDGRDDANSAAMDSASRFLSDRQEATKLAKHFFESVINDDINDA